MTRDDRARNTTQREVHGRHSDRLVGLRRRVEDCRAAAGRTAQTAQVAEQRLLDSQARLAVATEALAEAEAAVNRDAQFAARSEAHDDFRKAARDATTRADVDRATRQWLARVQGVNAAAREAAAEVERCSADLVAAQEVVAAESEAAAAARAEAETATAELEGAGRALAEAEAAVARASAAFKVAAPARALPEPAVEPAVEPVVDPAAEPAVEPVVEPSVAMAPLAEPASLTLGTVPAPSTSPSPTATPPSSSPALRLPPSAAAIAIEAEDEPAIVLGEADPPAILRILARDIPTLDAVARHLAGSGEGERGRVALMLADLVDALTAVAVEAGYLVFDEDDPFWGMFTTDQAREMERGLAAQGFQYDGLGGFANGHVPGRRELSLAVGNAGINPLRIRTWPAAEEISDLFRHVVVRADALLADHTPALSRDQVAAVLGPRAEPLRPLLDDWDRVRAALLARS